jgi:hypothetical protein
MLGCVPSKGAFDLFATAPLGPDSVLGVPSEGDTSFDAMGLSSPEGYVEIEIGYWKELTGEDG